MNDIVDYSKKLDIEVKKQRKFFLVIAFVVAFVAFSIGFYASYAFNNSESNKGHKNKWETIYEVLKDEWYYGVDDENIEKTLIDKAIYGMLDLQKDPFTQYLTSLGSLATSYEGLGVALIEYKEYFAVSEVESKVNIDAGLRKGDILISIDGNDLANKDLSYVKTLIEGKDEVVVEIKRGASTQTLIVYITKYTPVTVFKDFSSEEIAYIRVSEFTMDTASYLETYLKETKNLGYDKLIIDLRDNPGGYISSVVDCADLFMGKGKTVLSTKNKDGDLYRYKTKDANKYEFDKIVVLINNGSASGAEALSAALNENLGDIVDLVGVTTYGKGSAQKTMYFTDGTYFHYTYALWYTPSGESIHKKGVSPEIEYTGSGIHLLDFAKVELEKNDYGNNVYNLQAIMKKMGYYDEELTSFYGEDLENSMKKYQKDNELEETGKLDSITIRYILARYYDDKVADYRNEINEVMKNYKA